MYAWFAPAILLTLSNAFMTFAWYGHLKKTSTAIWAAILISWGIAFFEYVLQVPANRLGAANGLTTGQLKIMQELISLVVFAVFVKTYMNEDLGWRYYGAFGLVFAAVVLVSWK